MPMVWAWYDTEARVSARRAILLALLWGASACAESAQGEGKSPARPLPKVSVAQVREGSFEDAWILSGNVRAAHRAELAAGDEGSVTSATVHEGDAVSRGAVLLEVDPSLAGARYAVAKAEEAAGTELLEQARRELARLVKMGGRLEKMGMSSPSDAELERARSAVAEREAQQEALKARRMEAAAILERHRVRAPFDGIVSQRRVDLGDWVSAGAPVLDLVSIGDVDVVVDGPEGLFGRIAPGDQVLLDGQEQVRGKIVGLVPALDPVARTIRVRIKPDKKPPWLLPGASVQVRLTVRATGDGVVVPRDALVQDGKGMQVVVVREGKTESVQVQVLMTSRSDALVTSAALRVGEEVVVRGNERVRSGQAVLVVD